MDYKYIEQLLDRYFQAQTTREEESILRAFFSQEDVPAGLSKYQPLFAYQASETAEDTLDDSFDERVMRLVGEPVRVKARTIKLSQRLMPLFKAAAIVAIFLTLGNAAQQSFKPEDPGVAATAPAAQVEKGVPVAMTDTMVIDTVKHTDSRPMLKEAKDKL